MTVFGYCARVFPKFLRCFLFILALTLYFDNVVKVVLLIRISDKYFGTEEIAFIGHLLDNASQY